MVVERYLRAVAAQDWDVAAGCLAPDVTRAGPFGDDFAGRDVYLAHLREVMLSLAGYRMELGRLIPGAGDRTWTVELTETVEMGGRVVVTPECLIFDLDEDGLIQHIGIFIRTLGPAAGPG